MGEAVAVCTRAFGEDGRANRRVDEVEHVIFFDVCHPGEDSNLELPPDYRPEAEYPQRLIPQTFHSSTHHITDTSRQTQLIEVAGDRPMAVVPKHNAAGFTEVAQQLASEERVSIGLAPKRVGESNAVVIELMTGGRRHELDHLVIFKPLQHHPGDTRTAVEISQQRVEQITAPEIGLAISTYDHHVHRKRGCDYVSQQIEARRVGPMEIVKHN